MLHIVSEEAYQDGQIIIKEGSSGDWVYVIRSGEVEISKTFGGEKVVIEQLQPGEVFGELGFLGGIKRTATARAMGETTVGTIDHAFLDQEFNKLYADFRTMLIAVVKRFRKMIELTTELSSRKCTSILETLSLRYKDKQAFIDAYTGNLSSGGLLVRTENPLKQGEQFLLKLQLPGLSDSIKIKCEVVWSTDKSKKKSGPPIMGVKFAEMTKKNYQMLKHYLQNVVKLEKKD